MKKHLIKIWYDIPGQTSKVYEGLVTGEQRGNKVVISPCKLFYLAFHSRMPDKTKIIII